MSPLEGVGGDGTAAPAQGKAFLDNSTPRLTGEEDVVCRFGRFRSAVFARRESLATYAARTLAPEASLKEQLLPLELIAAVDKDRAKREADLLARLDDEGGRAQTLYFRTDDRTEPVPPRAGYYLGLLVAEQLAASGNDLATMTRWDAETAGSRVRHSLSALADASSSDSE